MLLVSPKLPDQLRDDLLNTGSENANVGRDKNIMIARMELRTLHEYPYVCT